MNTQRTLIGLLSMLVIAGGAAQPQDKAGVDDPPPVDALPADLLDTLRPVASQLLNVTDLELLQVEPRDWNGVKMVDVRLDDQMHVVHLAPFTLRAPDCRLLIQDATGELIPAELPPATTYRGHLETEPGSQVAASIMDGKTYMTILRADGEAWSVQPIEIDDLATGLPENVHVVYRSRDVLDHDGTCGVDEQLVLSAQPDPMRGPNDSGNSEAGPRVANIRAQIAFDADFEFYQANGSSVSATVTDMEMIMNQVGLVYQNQVAISYTETGILVRTAEPDPYTATNANTLICQFGEWWNNNGPFARDVGHLFTGKDLDGTTVGLAWIGALCAGNFNNCNAGGSNLSYGLVQSRFSTNLTNRIQDSAHELGHNWNGCHCNAGGNCNGTSNPNNCGIMTSNISGSLTFDSAAVTAITSFRDSRGCLDVWQNPTYVNGSYNGTETGSSSQPWNTINEGISAALVGGEVRAQAGNYFENLTIYKNLTIRAENGTVWIGN